MTVDTESIDLGPRASHSTDWSEMACLKGSNQKESARGGRYSKRQSCGSPAKGTDRRRSRAWHAMPV